MQKIQFLSELFTIQFDSFFISDLIAKPFDWLDQKSDLFVTVASLVLILNSLQKPLMILLLEYYNTGNMIIRSIYCNLLHRRRIYQ